MLADWQIRDAVRNGDLGIEPFNENNLNPHSYDITLGSDFKVLSPNRYVGTYLDPLDESTYDALLVDRITGIYGKPTQFPPNVLIIGTTQEYFDFPDDIVAQLEGKSSLARLGIEPHQTGGYIDAGFKGEITLEISSLLEVGVALTPGMPMGQLVFHRAEPAEVPYDKKKGSKYVGQTGPTLSKYYKNR